MAIEFDLSHARAMAIEAQVQQAVDNFVSKVTSLARQAAIETLTSVLTAGTRAGARRADAPPNHKSTIRRRKSGARRASADIAQLGTLLAKHIENHPGQRVEEINRALGTVTRDVARPLAKLISAGTVKTKGARRATRYFPR